MDDNAFEIQQLREQSTVVSYIGRHFVYTVNGRIGGLS
jgi:hypothetical protein